MDLTPIPAGTEATVIITATDGETIPASASRSFFSQGETILVFDLDGVPLAVAQAEPIVECDSPDGTPVPLDGTASTDADSSPGTRDDIAQFDWYEDFGFPGQVLLGTGVELSVPLALGSHDITLQVTDSRGARSMDPFSVEVTDTSPPDIFFSPVVTAECTGPDLTQVEPGPATAVDACFDEVSVDLVSPGLFPLGETPVTWTAEDPLGNSATAIQTVSVVDTTPPEMTMSLFPATLWPPNHRMVEVNTTVGATDLCSTPGMILEPVTSNEPDDGEGIGDGRTVNDIQDAAAGSFDTAFALRAERAGSGEGRTYTVTYLAVDGSGNETRAVRTVFVPHDLGGVTEPLLITAEENGLGTLIGWTEVPGAISYNIVRGEINRIKEREDDFHLGKLTCVANRIADPTTAGMEDPELPPMGEAFFYLVEYFDGAWSSYGSVDAAKERFAPPGQGNCP